MGFDSIDARRRVAHFRERGARILSTEAARRQDIASIGSTFQVAFEGPRGRITWKVLTEGERITAATYLRPCYINRSDDVYITKVMASVFGLVQDAPPEVVERVRYVKKHVPKALQAERWFIMLATQGVEQRFSNREVAELWFNAHAWHSDTEKQHFLRYVGEDEATICTTAWVSERLVLTKALLHFIDQLDEARYL